MPEKILYYLGAGASASCLPLAKSVWDGESPAKLLRPGLAYALESFQVEPILEHENCQEFWEELNILKEEFRKLANSTLNFGDVDTYAKYVYLVKDSSTELKLLKATLSKYFALVQAVLGFKDNRYLPWLVAIMDKRRFPSNVKVISWNYDFQLELAAAQMGDLETVNHSGNSFTYAPSFLLHYPNLDPTFSDFRELDLYHMNGIAGFTNIESMVKSSVFESGRLNNAKAILEFLFQSQQLDSSIHFAWERNSNYFKIEHIGEMISNTTILVIIGYSFPFFNREMDKMVFNTLRKTGSLRKIYYQDPILDGNHLRDKFALDAGIPIIHIAQTDTFHIPFEY